MSTSPTPITRRNRLWPIWGAVAGILGFAASVLTDTRPTSELEAADRGESIIVDPSFMHELTRMPNYLGFLLGFAAVAALVVFASAWRSRVESRHPDSIAARVVSGGLLISAAGLALAYGWKGALANYGYDGPERGLYEDDGLFVYFMLTDFGPYIPWLGVLIMAAAFAWLAWRERLVSRILGTISGIYFVLVTAAFIIMGVPGLAGPAGGLWLALASIWLAVGRSRVTERVDA
jgi:hypothetical protein